MPDIVSDFLAKHALGLTDARRTDAVIVFDGVDVTDDLSKYLISVEYKDNEGTDEADSLKITLQDKENNWTGNWLNQIYDSAVRNHIDPSLTEMRIEAFFIRRNWTEPGVNDFLYCGSFNVDDIHGEKGPNTVTISATSLPYTGGKQLPRTRLWENTTLKDAGQALARECGLQYMYLPLSNPALYSEQRNETDAAWLARVCRALGNYNLKFTAGAVVIYNPTEKKVGDPIDINEKDCYPASMDTGRAKTEYTSCRVWYTTPKGQLYEGRAYIKDYKPESKKNTELSLNLKVSSSSEAQKRAEYELARANSYAKTGSLTMPGNPQLVGGMEVELWGFGLWDGSYIAAQTTHTVDGRGGYKTSVNIRWNDIRQRPRTLLERIVKGGEALTAGKVNA